MQYDDRVLEGVGRILPENGFGSFSTEIPQRRAEYGKLNSLGTGTVGCVALDQNGKIW
jgi:L-asparaginase